MFVEFQVNQTLKLRTHSNFTIGETALRHLNHHVLKEFEKRASRVHCLLGFPLDMVTMDDVLAEIFEATRTRHRLFISTVNLNFVTQAQTDENFRNSLLSSNMCVADGIAVKSIGKLLGIPVPERVAGSDILSAVWANEPSDPKMPPLRVFFFGGMEEANRLACEAINQHPSGKIVCVGNLYPGYGSVEDMSSDAIVEKINRAKPDFLIVALGARKGQAWILQNMNKLEVPVISHLGATINFLAGTLERAPVYWQSAGLEWLWRIKQEPQLAGRYWNDGITLLKLLFTRIAPTSIWFLWNRWRWRLGGFSIHSVCLDEETAKLAIEGNFTSQNVEEFERAVTGKLAGQKSLSIDLSDINWIDAKALGSLLLLQEIAKKYNGALKITGTSASLQRVFVLNGLKCRLAH